MPADVQLNDLLESIRADGAQHVVQQYRHNVLPSRMLIDLYNDFPEKEVLLFLASYPTVPSQVLEDLTEAYPDHDIQAAAATNPRCSQLMLIRMARNGGTVTRRALAANRFHSPKVTAGLLRDPHWTVRHALAENSSIKPSHQIMLLLDPEPAVRLALSNVPRLPADLLHALSGDDSAVVRFNVYSRARVPKELLIGWAQSDSAEMHHGLIQRKGLPENLMRILSWSPDAVIQQLADRQVAPAIKTLAFRTESDIESVRIRTAQSEELPEELQYKLAQDPVVQVRVALASNPNLCEETALWIAASNDRAACIALAENSVIPTAAMLELCHHEIDDVRMRMAYRDDLTQEHLDVLVNQHDNGDLIGHLALRDIVYTETSTERVEQLLDRKQATFRKFAAASVHLTVEQKKRLLADPAPAVRLALCTNPTLNVRDLEILSTDWNPRVAAEAKPLFLERQPPKPKPKKKATRSGKRSAKNKESGTGLVSTLTRLFKD